VNAPGAIRLDLRATPTHRRVERRHFNGLSEYARANLGVLWANVHLPRYELLFRQEKLHLPKMKSGVLQMNRHLRHEQLHLRMGKLLLRAASLLVRLVKLDLLEPKLCARVARW
jgi:hypothetical protein